MAHHHLAVLILYFVHSDSLFNLDIHCHRLLLLASG